MRKTICFMLIIVEMCLVGCSISRDSDTALIDEQANEIVRCFDDKDIEGLKKLFCIKSQKNYDLDSEIKHAFELYEGKSVSFNVDLRGGWAGGKVNGEWDDKHYNPIIKEIETDNGEIYSIGYYTYLIYEYDTERIGIGAISLADNNGTEICKIGGWAE